MKEWTRRDLELITHYSQLLSADPSALDSFKMIKRGIEKESLRVNPDGSLATSNHPASLGSALTHPNVTTDYSEALVEFITPPFYTSKNALEFLRDLHKYSYSHLNDELLWVNSMPCSIADEGSIPIARYGSSNSGRMKSIYRMGLGHRYGRVMQTIAGIHYNFSLPEKFWRAYQNILDDKQPLQQFIDDQYFRIIRNFQRISWLPVYLFGASPVLCKSFIDVSQTTGKGGDIPSALKAMKTGSEKDTALYLPYGTSLRMSSLGYHNSAQADLDISYNSLTEYVESLEAAIRTPSTEYESIGLFENDEQIQLSLNILQIENEFYNSIRPKRTSKKGERPSTALKRGGVEYIEIRLLDLDPFAPGGTEELTLDFMDILLLFCLFSESAPLSKADQTNIHNNLEAIVTQGRDSNTLLTNTTDPKDKLTVKEYFDQLLPSLEPLAELMDAANSSKQYSVALKMQREKTLNPELTPSHHVVDALGHDQKGFIDFSVTLAEKQKKFLAAQTLNSSTKKSFDQISHLSQLRQKQLEQGDDISLEHYIANYFSQD